jgi:lysophospholipase L1-like esterase
MTRSFCLAGFVAAALCGQLSVAAESRWVGTWGCAPQLTEPANMPPAPGLAGNTVRQVVRATIGGKQARLRFSNLFGNGPLTIKSLQLALWAGVDAIRPDSGKPIAFHGQNSTTIAAGETVTSDSLDFDITPMADLAVTIWFGDVPTALTGHPGSRSTSYLQLGAAVNETSFQQVAKATHWYVLTGIDVMADGAEVIVLGDSITDGRGSTTDGNDRWTDDLARRLLANPATSGISVLNEGLGGNAVVRGGLGPPALTRFDRDVTGQNAPRWLIVLEGVNDIGASNSATVADDLIDAFGKFIDKAHARHIRVYGVPILPFGRSMYSNPAHEAARQKVNAWIRTSGKFDDVIDMDAAVRDLAEPANLLAAYDSGDHLHLNPEGYREMAAIIDLTLFRP